MGLYDTPQNDMGRLGYEMWRAARLVVDTGLHAKGWDKARAVAFMKDNTTLTDANVDAEVNRYISTPGQALAYKLGELKIRELRTLAEKELGPKFDLRHFHDAVLLQGPVPLDTLDAQVRAWIARRKRKASEPSGLLLRARCRSSVLSSRSFTARLISWIRQPVRAARTDRRAAADAGRADVFQSCARWPRTRAPGAVPLGRSVAGQADSARLSGMRLQTTISSSVERGHGSVP